MLPCGKTLAQSWAALRKAWLGFKIALGNDDTAQMKHYASFIVKVQSEMGIQTTNFDRDILDESSVVEENYHFKSNAEKDVMDEEDELDYDWIMENARTIVNSHRCDLRAQPSLDIYDGSERPLRHLPKNRPREKNSNSRPSSNTKGFLKHKVPKNMPRQLREKECYCKSSGSKEDENEEEGRRRSGRSGDMEEIIAVDEDDCKLLDNESEIYSQDEKQEDGRRGSGDMEEIVAVDESDPEVEKDDPAV
jgi:hypothetical protein